MDDLANDPEFQAELEYASKNGIDVHSLNNVKARLTKSKSQEDGTIFLLLCLLSVLNW